MNTWTKLKDGSWGIRIEGVANPGETIWVSRKDGGRAPVVVGQILWTGGGVMLATKGVKGKTLPLPQPVVEPLSPWASREEQDAYDAEIRSEYEASCF